MKGPLALGLAVAAAAIAVLWPPLPPLENVPRPASSVPAPAAARATQSQGTEWMSALPETGPVPAWQSMAAARERGDERAPPLAPAAPRETAPSAAQLADPAAYAALEQGRQAKLMASYAAAVDSELPRLRADVDRARTAGIAPEEIAKVEAKITRLEALRRAIAERGTID